MDGTHIITLKKRPFPQRFINSYRVWRQHLGVPASLMAAWTIATARPAQKNPQSAYYDPKQFRR
jgi:hypothetical protein